MKYEVVEMTKSQSIQDFLIAVNLKFFMFFNNYRMTINRDCQNSELSKMLKQFRLFIKQERFFQNEQSISFYEVFAIISELSNQLEQKKRSTNSNSTLNEKSSWWYDICICEFVHSFDCCWYLALIKRTSKWNSNLKIQQRVDLTMKNTVTKKRVRSFMESWKNRSNSLKEKRKFKKEKNQFNNQSTSDENSQNQQQEQPQSPSSSPSSSQQNRQQQTQDFDWFVVLSEESFSFMIIKLEKFLFIIISWILDNGSNVHVCNRHMKHWFIHTRNETREFLAVNSNEKEIEIYEDMMIIISNSFDSREIKLSNVHYMSNFITNIVSLRLLRAKEIDFNSYSMHLHWARITKWYVIEFNEYFFLEDNIAICFVIKRLKDTFIDIKIVVVIKIASRRD